MAGKVKIECASQGSIPLNKLKQFQGGLKELSPANYDKLKKQILELGFSEPIVVWKNKGKVFIINGHQRIKALEMMKKEGIEIPKEIPAAQIKAKNIKEAKEKVLALTSTFGEITKEGLTEFIDDLGIDLDFIAENYSFNTINIEKLRYEASGGPQEKIDVEKLQEELDGETYDRQEVIIFNFESQEKSDYVREYFKSESKVIDGKLLVKEIEK